MVANTNETVLERTKEPERTEEPTPLELPNRSSYDRFGTIVDDAGLLPLTPEAAGIETTKSHRPVPMAELAANVQFAMDRNQITFGQPLHIVSGKTDSNGDERFTEFETRWVVTHKNIDPAIGRGSLPVQRIVTLGCSYSKKRAATLGFGLSMTVCANGLVIFDAEFMAKRKQTPGLEHDQFGFLFGGIGTAVKQFGFQNKRVAELEDVPFSSDQMKIAACNMATKGVLNPASIMKVVNEYDICETDKADEIQATWTDRNLWNAINCVTAVQQGSAGHRANVFGQTARDQKTVDVMESVACPKVESVAVLETVTNG